MKLFCQVCETPLISAVIAPDRVRLFRSLFGAQQRTHHTPRHTHTHTQGRFGSSGPIYPQLGGVAIYSCRVTACGALTDFELISPYTIHTRCSAMFARSRNWPTVLTNYSAVGLAHWSSKYLRIVSLLDRRLTHWFPCNHTFVLSLLLT